MTLEYTDLRRFAVMMVQRLGDSIRDQAAMIGMPHATLARRMADPSQFTLAELETITRAVQRSSEASKLEVIGRAVVREP